MSLEFRASLLAWLWEELDAGLALDVLVAPGVVAGLLLFEANRALRASRVSGWPSPR